MDGQACQMLSPFTLSLFLLSQNTHTLLLADKKCVTSQWQKRYHEKSPNI